MTDHGECNCEQALALKKVAGNALREVERLQREVTYLRGVVDGVTGAYREGVVAIKQEPRK